MRPVLFLAFWFVPQQGTWETAPAGVTVGDTIWVARRLAAPPGTEVRIVDPPSTEAFAPLEPGRVERSADGLAVRYPGAAFVAGRVAVPTPRLELRHPDGRTAVVPGDTVWVTVRSVLPAGEAEPEPRPALDPVERPRRSLLPAVILGALATVGVGGWAAFRRRRRPRPVWSVPAPPGEPPPLDRWEADGEIRAVAAQAAARLRGRIAARVPEAGSGIRVEECLAVVARERPDWPLRELADVLHALDRARFAPAVPEAVAGLARRAAALEEDLT